MNGTSTTVSKDGKTAANERAERLAAALKENLRRRKAQVRNRRDAEGNDAEVSENRASDGEGSKDGSDND